MASQTLRYDDEDSGSMRGAIETLAKAFEALADETARALKTVELERDEAIEARDDFERERDEARDRVTELEALERAS